jgi:lysophospholipase L1-like esterase
VTVVPAGSLAQHTIRIWGNGGTYTPWSIKGRTKAGTIEISNTAISGRSLGSFMGSGNNDETTGRFGLPFLDTLKSDVVVIALGVNDWQGSTPTATIKTYLNTLITRVKAYGGVPVLYVVPQPAVELQPSGGPTYTAYVTAFLEVAAASGTAILNHQKLWASDSVTNENDIWLAGVALGKYGSTNPATAGRIHPNDSGLADMGVNGYGTKQSIRAFLGI